jgi:hypothetical protein
MPRWINEQDMYRNNKLIIHTELIISSLLPLAEHARIFVPRMLDVR